MSKVSESPDSNAISDERWKAVEEIASSSTFRRSPRLKELLLFIAKHSLAGNDEQLTESEIARQVFGRGSDYVATEDSIVRSSARQLRWKLKEFGEKNEPQPAWARAAARLGNRHSERQICRSLPASRRSPATPNPEKITQPVADDRGRACRRCRSLVGREYLASAPPVWIASGRQSWLGGNARHGAPG